MIRLLRPLGPGLGCLDNDWYDDATCPERLYLQLDSPVFTTHPLAINFDGRGWAYEGIPGISDCGSPDPYVTFNPNPAVVGAAVFGVAVDVWQAFFDGVWTSSVDIEVRCGQISFTGPLKAYREKFVADPTLDPGLVSKTIGGNINPCVNWTTLRATITVNDDGTWSIA